METVLIELTNQNAKKLLQEMEALNLIKLLKENISENKTLSEKYAGKLPSAIADELQDFVSQSRNEWNRNI